MSSKKKSKSKKSDIVKELEPRSPFDGIAEMPTVFDVLTAKETHPLGSLYAQQRVIDTMWSHVKKECLSHVKLLRSNLIAEREKLQDDFRRAQDLHYNKLFEFIKKCDATIASEDKAAVAAYERSKLAMMQTYERIAAQTQKIEQSQAKIRKLQQQLEELDATKTEILRYEHRGGLQADMQTIQHLQAKIAPTESRYKEDLERIKSSHENSVQIAMWHLESVLNSIESKAANDVLGCAQSEEIECILTNRRLVQQIAKVNHQIEARNNDLSRLVEENIRQSVAHLVVDWNMNYGADQEIAETTVDLVEHVEDIFDQVEGGLKDLYLDLEDMDISTVEKACPNLSNAMTSKHDPAEAPFSVPTLASENQFTGNSVSPQLVMQLEEDLRQEIIESRQKRIAKDGTSYFKSQIDQIAKYSQRNFRL